jgi:hypothetical protein
MSLDTYNKEDFDKLVEGFKNQKGADLSLAEDLSLAVMNLISLEEHFFFTAVKTGKDSYFDTSSEIRNLRKEAMESLVPKHEGETWCATKHLLSSTMRLIEVANRLQADGKKEEAKKMFYRAYKTYSIFWALRLKLISAQNGAEILSNSKEEKKTGNNDSGDSKQWTVEDITTKLADCCKE